MEQNNNTQKSTLLNIFIGFITLIIAVFTVKYFYGRFHYTYTDDASIMQNAVPVNCRVGGFVENIYFDEFTEVHKGDTILTVAPADYLIGFARAEAGLETAEAAREIMQASVLTLKNAQNIAEANLLEVNIRLQNAQKDFERYQKLLQEKSTTRQQYDRVKTEYESLKARYSAAVKALNGAKLSTSEAQSRLRASDVGVKAARVGVTAAKQNLLYTTVTSPCNGFTGRKFIHKGQLLQTGQSIVQIIEKDKKWITANFLEKQTTNLYPGAEADIKIDALPDVEIRGIVKSVAGATGSVFSLIPTDNATGNFVKVQQRIPVRIEFDKNISEELFNELRAGMNAEVYINK